MTWNDDGWGDPVRRVRRVRIERDQDGRIVRQVVMSSDFVIDEHGRITQVETEDQTRYHSCGCNADQPPAGKCRGCDRVSCTKCFTRCNECRSPLCLSCAEYLIVDGSRELTFCPNCIGPAKRWRYADAVLTIMEEFDRG